VRSSQLVEVTSLTGFIKAVQQVVEDWTPRGAEWYLQPWFRGHGDASWPLAPSLYRPESKTQGVGAEYYNEALLLERFRLRAPTFLERLPETDWEWLFLMQHYGLPTRLLDWTESSLIALYFAIRDHTGDVDAAVWAMNPWWLNRLTLGKYTLFPANDPRAKKHAPLPSGKKLKGRLPLAITPNHASPRIAAQRGVFTIHGHQRAPLDRLVPRRVKGPSELRKLVIKKNCISRILTDLAISGISESLIFPELSGLCREIKTDFFD
jgi:FRG domain